MIPFSIQSPSVYWSDGRGYFHHAGLTREIDARPPVESLADASMIDWCPRLNWARCVVAGERRDLTEIEQQDLLRWVSGASAVLDDYIDGGTTLAVVVWGSDVLP